MKIQLSVLMLLTLLYPLAQAHGQHWPSAEQEDEILFSYDGLRVSRYRSPTPESVPGATTLDTLRLQQLLQQEPDTLLLDVQPVAWRHGIFVPSKPRQNIKGSYWIPNVGYGHLEEDWSQYLSHWLNKLSSGNLQQPMVFYCNVDCWMSWNAVQHTASLGYKRLFWYRSGVEEWLEQQLPKQSARPLPTKHSTASFDGSAANQ